MTVSESLSQTDSFKIPDSFRIQEVKATVLHKDAMINSAVASLFIFIDVTGNTVSKR